jgi:hypothetical protein
MTVMKDVALGMLYQRADEKLWCLWRVVRLEKKKSLSLCRIVEYGSKKSRLRQLFEEQGWAADETAKRPLLNRNGGRSMARDEDEEQGLSQAAMHTVSKLRDTTRTNQKLGVTTV